MRELLIKGGIFAAALGLAGVVALPMLQRSKLAEQFQPAVSRYGGVSYKAREEGGKDGRLSWPNKVASIDRSKLPEIPGAVFVMTPRKVTIDERGRRIKEAKIHDTFFDLDPSLRAADPDSVKTLVYAKTEFRGFHYQAMHGPGAARVLTLKVVYLQIFDLEKKVLLGSWLLEGEKPPTFMNASETPQLEEPPSPARFLEALPRR